MTDRELMQQALEALEDVDAVPYERVHAIVEALRERLLQKDEPSAEPVAYRYRYIDGWRTNGGGPVNGVHPVECQPLYTSPPPRTPLTDETLWEMWVESPSDVLRFARAIERAHGIKG